MDWINLLLKAILFMLLVPGVHLTIPLGASLREQALIHGVVFAVVNYFVYLYIRPMLEGFKNPDTRTPVPCPPGSVRHGSDCRMKGEGESP
jgi:hypothetical protein